MSALLTKPNAYYLGLLSAPPEYTGDWRVNNQGLHLTTDGAGQVAVHVVPWDILDAVHPALLPALRLTSALRACDTWLLYAQMRYLLDPVNLPDAAGNPNWLFLIKNLHWQPGRTTVDVMAWVYDLVTSGTITYVDNVRLATFKTATTTLDAEAPGWQERYLVAESLGLTRQDLVQHVCTVPSAPTPTLLPDFDAG